MEDIRPTAKWANRMLRPLTSVYHRLEKHHEIVTSVLISKTREKAKEKEAAPGVEQRTRLVSTKTSVEPGCSYSDDEEPNDPAWIPGVGKDMDKRRIRHNYSSRGRGAGGVPRRRSRLLIRSPEAPKTLPGAIEIATPLITGKVRGGGSLTEASPSLRMQFFQSNLPVSVDSGPSGHRRPGRTNNSSFRPYQGSWKEVLDQSGDHGLVNIAHLLDRILLKFLKSTQVPSPTEQGRGGRRGARSLLSMAVRRFPEFIAEEQRIQDELDEDCDVDMCDAYFTELEASYAPGGNGWQPLREAVRAQGIYLVSCMIENRWITSLAACRLLEECLFQQELDAFESLQTKLLASADAYHYPTTFDPPRSTGHRGPVQILASHYRRHPERHSYVFEELTGLLMRGAMPPEWMVTSLWKKSVDKAIKMVSAKDSGYPAARRLIEAVILSSAGIYSDSGSVALSLQKQQAQTRQARPRQTRTSVRHSSDLLTSQSSCPIPIQDALSNLVSSLLTALCGISIARFQAADANERSAGLKTREMVNYLSFTVQQAIGIETAAFETEILTLHQLRRGSVLLADCTLHCGKSVTPEIIYHSESLLERNIEAFCGGLASRQDVVKELARLVSQVFHYSEHAQEWSSTPKGIRARVAQLAQLTSATGVALLLGKVAAEAAMELAEKSLDPDDHTWAVEIQELAALSQQSVSSSPSSSQVSTSLYRWEDSIGEWVARTPAAKPRAIAAAIAAKQQEKPPARRRGRPRIIACSMSSSSASSICSEKSNSSVTSSATSVPRKRLCASQDPSPQPFKKAYHTRSVERVGSNWTNARDRSPCQSSPEAIHVPVAARTRTGLRDVLRRQSVGQQYSSVPVRTENIPVDPTSPTTNTIEVVIVNKSPLVPEPSHAAASTEHRPIKRRGRPRGSSVIPRTTRGLLRRRQSAPARVTRRRSLRSTTIPCSQDDESEDELSFL
ncbi:uncharacterized protein BDV14DRAFT_164287 [Aspergillus stella-maris]|uniref:uncharacterized protein n=1 Tax=Aspergillus stella-maris TaxID=1810926 RepID=UPI003CCCDE2F